MRSNSVPATWQPAEPFTSSRRLHDATPIDGSEFVAPRGTFVVAYLDGVAMACGGWRAHEPGPEFAGYTEIPRFGLYRCDPRSRCFGKLLPVAVQPAR